MKNDGRSAFINHAEVFEDGYIYMAEICKGLSFCLLNTATQKSIRGISMPAGGEEWPDDKKHSFIVQFTLRQQQKYPPQGQQDIIGGFSYGKLSDEFCPEGRAGDRRLVICFTSDLIGRMLPPASVEVIRSCFGEKPVRIDPAILNFESRMLAEQIFGINLLGDLDRLVLQNRVLMLLEYFLNHLLVKSTLPAINEEDRKKIIEIERVITSNELEQFPSIDVLSRIAMMSATKLKKKFKEMYGMKIYQYYNHCRLQKAKNILMARDITVKEVAYTIGFSNISNFCRAFNREFGFFPGSLRSRKA